MVGRDMPEEYWNIFFLIFYGVKANSKMNGDEKLKKIECRTPDIFACLYNLYNVF